MGWKRVSSKQAIREMNPSNRTNMGWKPSLVAANVALRAFF
jgi:hypothetical protein